MTGAPRRNRLCKIATRLRSIGCESGQCRNGDPGSTTRAASKPREPVGRLRRETCYPRRPSSWPGHLVSATTGLPTPRKTYQTQVSELR
jgi:hypothetical protein